MFYTLVYHHFDNDFRQTRLHKSNCSLPQSYYTRRHFHKVGCKRIRRCLKIDKSCSRTAYAWTGIGNGKSCSTVLASEIHLFLALKTIIKSRLRPHSFPAGWRKTVVRFLLRHSEIYLAYGHAKWSSVGPHVSHLHVHAVVA